MKPDPAGRLARAKEALAGGRTREALRLAQELAASPAAPQELRVEALCLEAEVHRRLGRPAEALAALEQALALAPERPALHYWRGRLLDGMGRIREASEALEQACRLAPRWAEAHSWAGHLCARLGDHPRRLAHQEAILRMRPTDRAALYNRASALLATTRVEEALAAFRQARSVEERPEYVAGEVTALLQLGRHEEAWRLLQPWLSAAPPQHSLGIAFADLAPRLGRVEEAIAYLRGLLDREAALNDIQRQSLHFALGRLYDRAGNPDRAFLHLHTANEMAPRAFPAAGWERFLERTLAVFPPEAAAQAPRARRRDPRPVLILGMPRSGTSLVEQILASHPRVHGAGELHALERLGLELLERAEEAGGLSGLPVELLDGLAERYLAKAGREAGPAARITDKMPTNFLWLGTAMLALPGARVVHVRRHPLDTLWSCYERNLQGLHSYSNRFEDLAFFYRLYRRLMDHWEQWRQALDLPLLELRYEALVERPEEQVRRLLDFLELPWDEACLRFHESRRVVRTASHDQVRRPLYRGAVGRWRRYAPYLEPLRRELAEFLDEQAPYGYP